MSILPRLGVIAQVERGSGAFAFPIAQGAIMLMADGNVLFRHCASNADY